MSTSIFKELLDLVYNLVVIILALSYADDFKKLSFVYDLMVIVLFLWITYDLSHSSGFSLLFCSFFAVLISLFVTSALSIKFEESDSIRNLMAIVLYFGILYGLHHFSHLTVLFCSLIALPVSIVLAAIASTLRAITKFALQSLKIP